MKKFFPPLDVSVILMYHGENGRRWPCESHLESVARVRKVQRGCDHCYMFYLDAARGQDGSILRRTKTNFDLPLKRDRTGAYKVPVGSELMVCMNSDFFLPEADEWREAVWDMIRRRWDVTFWLQTKRIFHVADRLPPDWGGGWHNVKFCVTAENQKRVDERLPELLRLPFAYKAVMCAPMLSAVDLSPYLATGQIRYVLADGENYDGQRPCYYEWIKSLYDQCARYGTDFSFVGTGNVFVKDGREYRICKAYQKIQAKRSGLQIPAVDTNIPIRKKCAVCLRNSSCNGCKNCGRCKS